MIRHARLKDAPEINLLINSHAERGRMLFRSLANLYESIRDFQVYEREGQILGCCALQIIWSDLAEIKSLAVRKEYQSQGIGRELVNSALDQARQLQLPKVFTLTLEKEFFQKLGFEMVPMDSLPMKVWSDCVQCPKQATCDEIAMVYPLEA